MMKQGTQGSANPECELVSRELDGLFGASRCELSPAARRHLAECESCQGLHRWMTEAAEGTGLEEVPPELAGRIGGRLKADLKPVRPMPCVMELVLRFLGVFGVLLALLIGLWVWRGMVLMPTWQSAAMVAMAVAGVALLAASVARQMQPGSRRLALEGPALAAAAVALLGGFAVLFPWRQVSGFPAAGWNCFLPGIGMAIPAALVLWFVARRGVPQSLPGVGAALGAMGGLLGMAALEFSCSNEEAVHLLVWHAGVLVASAAGGALAGYVASRVTQRLV